MHDLIIEGIQLAVFLAQGYLLQAFFGEFAEKRFLPGRWNGVAVLAVYGILRYGIYFVFMASPTSGTIEILLRMALTFLSILAVALCFYQAENNLRIFLVVTFSAVCECCFFLAYMVMQMGRYVTDLWVALFDRGFFASADNFLNTVETSMIFILGLMYGVHILLAWIFLQKIVKYFRAKEHVIGKKELWFLLTPGLVGLLLCVLLRMIMIAVEDGVPRLLYDRYPPLMGLVPAILLLALMSILFGVKLFQDMVDLNREKSSRIVLEKQLDGMQAQMREMERIYSGVRSMKHDMKNTLSVVMQLAGKGGGENGELQEYLSEMNKCFERLESPFQTGNSVVDALLAMKYHEMIREIPEARLEAEGLIFPENLQIQSFDLGIIIGNALDNALEACRKLKCKRPEAECFIRLCSFQKGKMFFVEVENSCERGIIKEPHSEFPKTDKEDKSAHGMGLMNIKNTAERYDGGVDWSVSAGVFTLSVMMKNERRREYVY